MNKSCCAEDPTCSQKGSTSPVFFELLTVVVQRSQSVSNRRRRQIRIKFCRFLFIEFVVLLNIFISWGSKTLNYSNVTTFIPNYRETDDLRVTQMYYYWTLFKSSHWSLITWLNISSVLSLSSGLRPSEEHLKADYITTGSLSQSEAPPDAPSSPCFWRTHRYDPSRPHISQDPLHIQKRRKKERKWCHGVA